MVAHTVAGSLPFEVRRSDGAAGETRRWVRRKRPYSQEVRKVFDLISTPVCHLLPLSSLCASSTSSQEARKAQNEKQLQQTRPVTSAVLWWRTAIWVAALMWELASRTQRLFCLLKASITPLCIEIKQTHRFTLQRWMSLITHGADTTMTDITALPQSARLQQRPLGGICNRSLPLKLQCVSVIRGRVGLSGSSGASRHLSQENSPYFFSFTPHKRKHRHKLHVWSSSERQRAGDCCRLFCFLPVERREQRGCPEGEHLIRTRVFHMRSKEQTDVWICPFFNHDV